MAVIREQDLGKGRAAFEQWQDAAHNIFSEQLPADDDAAFDFRLNFSPRLPRQLWAMAVRYSLYLLEKKAPGEGVEVRVAPWGAIKILDGPASDPHNLTPPDVIELDPDVWMRLATGITSWDEEKDAGRITAVMPYFGWARQDRKDRPRVPIGAKLVANMLVAAGVDRIMTMDLHADQIQGFFDVPVDALYASGIFVPYIKSLNIEDLSIAAPDMGGAKRANTYAKHLSAPIIISHKERAKANVVGKMTAIGDVKGRNVIIVDDMIDTAGTICMAADMLMEKGAKSVRAAITHPILSGQAYEKINASALQEVIVTDTIPLNPEKDLSKFKVMTVADIFANVIERVHNYKEISSIFFK